MNKVNLSYESAKGKVERTLVKLINLITKITVKWLVLKPTKVKEEIEHIMVLHKTKVFGLNNYSFYSCIYPGYYSYNFNWQINLSQLTVYTGHLKIHILRYLKDIFISNLAIYEEH